LTGRAQAGLREVLLHIEGTLRMQQKLLAASCDFELEADDDDD